MLGPLAALADIWSINDASRQAIMCYTETVYESVNVAVAPQARAALPTRKAGPSAAATASLSWIAFAPAAPWNRNRSPIPPPGAGLLLVTPLIPKIWIPVPVGLIAWVQDRMNSCGSGNTDGSDCPPE